MASTIKVDEILDSQGNQFDGSQLGNVGKVLQVKSFHDSSVASQYINSTSYQPTSLEISITPSSVNSKILILMGAGVGFDDTDGAQIFAGLFRNNSVEINSMSIGRDYVSSAWNTSFHMSYLDNPQTTSSITYTLYGKSTSSGLDFRYGTYDKSGVITVMEIGE